MNTSYELPWTAAKTSLGSVDRRGLGGATGMETYVVLRVCTRHVAERNLPDYSGLCSEMAS